MTEKTLPQQTELFEKGLSVRRAVVGSAYADKSLSRIQRKNS